MAGTWQASRILPQENIDPKKLLVTNEVWWTSRGVVHYTFLKSGQTNAADVYCQRLQAMMEKLAARPRSIAGQSLYATAASRQR